MIEINRIPIGSVEDVFGEAGDESNFVKLLFPFPMKASWDHSLKITNFYGHRFIAEATIEALEEIKKYYSETYILDHGLNIYGGCYNNRMTVSGKRKSIHAWGLAVDYVPHLGEYGRPSMIPYHIVNAFKKRGFVWGGDWSYPDGQHFSGVEE